MGDHHQDIELELLGQDVDEFHAETPLLTEVTRAISIEHNPLGDERASLSGAIHDNSAALSS
jgi:hypothetical protein